MDQLYLGDHEISYYFDLCDTYDPSKQGRIPSHQVITLLTRANLQTNVLHKIIQFCGASRQTLINRTQFFTALKLVSLAQSGHEVSMESLHLHGRMLPIPSFSIKPIVDNRISTHAFLRQGKQHDYSNENALHSIADSMPDDVGTLSEISTPFSTDASSSVDWPTKKSSFLKPAATNWATFDDHQSSPTAKLSPHQSSSETEDDNAFDGNVHPTLAGSKNIPYTLLNEPSHPNRLDNGTWTPNFSDSGASSFVSENRVIEIAPFECPTPTRKINSPSSISSKFTSIALDTPHNQAPTSPNAFRFWLSPDEESEYAIQFDTLLSPSDRISENPSLSLSRIRPHFSAQYDVADARMDEIWRLSDLDRDNRLNQAEFCLASHLAHLHGHERLSINDAVTATASYIAKRVPTFDRTASGSNQQSPSTRDSPRIYSALESNGYPSDHSDEEKLLTGHEDDDDQIESLIPSDSRTGRNVSDFTAFRHRTSSSSSSSSQSFSTSNSEASLPSSSSHCSSSTPITDDEDSGENADYIDTSAHWVKEGRKRKHRRCDPIRLLAATLERPLSHILRLSTSQRRHLLNAIIREAKGVNHSLLRLNNELHGEWTELKDQRVNISAQLQHLGLLPLVNRSSVTDHG